MERVYNTYSGVYDVLFGKVFQSGRELGPELLDLFPGNNSGRLSKVIVPRQRERNYEETEKQKPEPFIWAGPISPEKNR